MVGRCPLFSSSVMLLSGRQDDEHGSSQSKLPYFGRKMSQLSLDEKLIHQVSLRQGAGNCKERDRCLLNRTGKSCPGGSGHC